jgi:transcriptional regulator with XRE-family HTH domain
MAPVNGQVMEWARIRAGLSIEDVASAFKKTPSDVEAWENDASSPTYRQLEKLSYQLYKRPLALFYFP